MRTLHLPASPHCAPSIVRHFNCALLVDASCASVSSLSGNGPLILLIGNLYHFFTTAYYDRCGPLNTIPSSVLSAFIFVVFHQCCVLQCLITNIFFFSFTLIQNRHEKTKIRQIEVLA